MSVTDYDLITRMKLSDIDIFDVGHTIQLAGAIWSGNGKLFLVPLPGENLEGDKVLLELSAADWERFLNQSDVLDMRGPDKAILRKSQRLVDQAIAWRVYERDGYRCRYCYRKAPLTVDHIILWEDGGATVEQNLLACCRRCNKVRGSMPYEDWLRSKEYAEVSKGLLVTKKLNEQVLESLPKLSAIKAKPRSR